MLSEFNKCMVEYIFVEFIKYNILYHNFYVKGSILIK